MRYLFLLLGFVLTLQACTLTENIQDGQTAWNLKKYGLAAQLLEKEFSKEDPANDNGALAFQIGRCYLYTGNSSAAASWFKKAIEWEYGSEAILQYAFTLKRLEQYDDAIEQFNEYLKEEPYRRPEINVEINACEQAIAWKARQEDEFERDTYVSNIRVLNSPDADFQLVHAADDLVLFTSSRASATGENKDSWTGNQYYDLFQSTTDRPGSFAVPIPWEAGMNTPYNDGSVVFNSNYSEMYLVRCGSDNKKIDDYCSIYVSYRQPGDTWTEPLELKFFEDSLNLGMPCLSPDDQTLFFIATDPNGEGGSDIYFAKRLLDGWDIPQNAGTSVNSEGNEAFPTFGPDGTFYFSSDGLPGMGGLDIFSANWNGNKFTKVSNLEYPINSGEDDFALLMETRPVGKDTLSMGYFSSGRSGGSGSDDLYQYIRTNKKPRPPVFVLQVRVLRKIYEDSLDVTSKPVDTVYLPGAALSAGLSGAMNILPVFMQGNDPDSIYTAEVNVGETYSLKASMDGFFARSENISTTGWTAAPGDTLVVLYEMVLDQIPTSTTTQIRLNNIYYDFNDTTLRPESFPELDQLVTLLTENPGLTIQINSHTDARGKDSYNQKLSQGRANSVVVYLISKGIAQERLFAKGVGESEPDVIRADVSTPSGVLVPKGTVLTEKFINTFKSNKDDFEFLHQFNRRTTFAVLSDDFRLESETPDDVEVDPAPDDGVRDDTPKKD